MDYPIDFVVTWLDSSDLDWQEQYYKYKKTVDEGDQTKARFRDWELFKYWFRAVENFVPWVNRVFLVTNGKFPDWINENHPKLVLIKHSDYIPEEFLPTFNSCTIELHMNKIPGLSEHFVYFNDDCFINAPITPEYYFRDGLPCDNNKETVFNVAHFNPIDRFNIYISMFTNICVINRYFDRRESVKQSPKRWYGLHLGKGGLLTSLFLKLYNDPRFVGFNWRHVEQPYLKSVWDEAWGKEPEMLNNSCTRFREDVILNPYFFRYWQFASNKFYPVKLNRVKKIRAVKQGIPLIISALEDRNVYSLCINDTPFCTDDEFISFKEQLRCAFDKKFPIKSSFEV